MRREPIEFVVDGMTLRGSLYFAEQPKNLAVFFVHGWTGRPNETAAMALARNGYTAMTFSLRGHGGSEGKLEEVTRAGSLKDVLIAYDLFKSRTPSNTKIVAAGSSYGSYMAALLSAKRSLFALSLRVPANYPDEHFAEPQLPQAPNLTQWRKKIITHDVTMSLKALNKFGGAVQILEAGEDEVVPPETVRNYVNAVKDKSKLDYHLMKGWPHGLGDDPERNRQYQKLLLDWLSEQV